MKKRRVVIAMSGGVDSSVAAALLKKKGYDTVGITMCFNLPDAAGKRPICCGTKGIEDARRVAHKLNIRHYVLNMQRALQQKVIRDFCQEYIKGRTPNPCVRCNQYLKFGFLLEKALALDAQFLATGHYAQIVTGQPYLLKKAKDKTKDQSYFLYRLGQEQLKRTLFPLGNYTKQEVRDLARGFGLSVAEKLASQEICFLSNADYRPFLKNQMPEAIRQGLIVDSQGNVLARHKGIAFYTIGQRQGLGIAKGYPLYVTQIDPKNNRITVGRKEDAQKREFLLKEVHFISRPIEKKVAARVRIRYNHKEALAQLEPSKNKIKVRFKEPQFAITCGQSAVFYRGDIVFGGGIIEKVLS